MNNLRRQIFGISAVGALTMAMTMTGVSGGGVSAAATGGGTETIGVIEHQTGPSAFYGLTEIKGMEAAAKVVNSQGGILGKKIVFDILDDTDTPSVSVQDVKQLAADSKIPVILGPTNAPDDLADAPVAAQQKIPEIFNTGGVSTLPGKWAYTVLMPYPYMTTYTLQTFFKKTGDKTAALVTQSNNSAFTGIHSTIKNELSKLGVKLVADESYQQGTLDFSPIITPIKSKQPQAIILNMIDTDAARFVAQARQAGVTGQWVGSTNSELTTALQNAPGGAANNMVVAGVYPLTNPSPDLKKYLSTTKSLYGNSLLSVAVYGYDSVLLLKQAVDKAGSWNRAKINQALQNTTRFVGAVGTYTKHDGNQFWQTNPPIEQLKGKNFVAYRG